MWRALFLVCLLPSVAFALPPGPQDVDGTAFKAVLERMGDVATNLKDCTFTLYKTEYVSGKLTAEEAMEVQFRPASDLFVEYTEGKGAGQKVLYRGKDWNKGKLRVDPGRFIPVLNIDPEGALARRGNRHTIYDLPSTVLVEKIVRDALKVNDHARWLPEVTDLGLEDVRSEKGRCFLTVTPKAEDASFYAYKTRLCVNEQTGMPNAIEVWDIEDGELRIVEAYQYVGMKLNVGLGDRDFDPDTHGL
jgi:hypothetical protein